MAHSILIIDDERVFLISMAAFLRDKGFKIHKASDGIQGLKLAQEILPDIIITDWDLPHLSGIEIIKELQTHSSTKDIPVIVSSGILITVKDLEMAFQAGAIDFVRKPIEKVELLARINSAIRLFESSKQLKKEKQQLEFVNAELKRLQNKLVHKEKMNSISQLTSGVAHEINNPLNFVLGGAEAINLIVSDLQEVLLRLVGVNAEHLSTEEIALELIKIQEELEENKTFEELSLLATDVKEGGQRIMRIVHGLSAFAQIESTGVVLGNIHEGLNATLMLLTNQYQERIKVEKIFDSKISQFEADHGALNQVFLNILTNAIQAIKNKGHIRIQTKQLDNNRLQIEFTDSGKGMPEYMVEKIFLPYFSIDDAQKGYGIGLSVSHNIISEHGGTITCTSKEENGTTFTIELPIQK